MTKPKLCKQCRQEFKQWSSTQVICSIDCAIKFGIELNKKTDRVDLKKRKESLKTRADWLRECQTIFNKFIRLRDANEPCISCQRHHTGQYHAGHFKSVGSNPQLRFNEKNCHKQCAPCNNHLSGNVLLFRFNLIKKIGIEEVEKLEADKEPARYTIEQIQFLMKNYKLKIKELLNAQQT